MNRLSVVSKIANQYGNGNGKTALAEGNGNGINGNLIRCYNCRGEGHYASNYTVKLRKYDAAYLQQQLQIAQKEEACIQSTQEEFEFMAAADAYEETKKVKVNCTSEKLERERYRERAVGPTSGRRYLLMCKRTSSSSIFTFPKVNRARLNSPNLDDGDPTTLQPFKLSFQNFYSFP
ncbi:hypothetical protein Tco_0217124 [Tanacetum coccineum]